MRFPRISGPLLLAVWLPLPGPAAPDPGLAAISPLVQEYCIDCHDSISHKGDLSLEGLDPADPSAAATWEKVVRKLDHRLMPPLIEARPDEATYAHVVAALSASLDQTAQAHPRPGRTDALRRLNRTEYQNAVRDLLAVEIDATDLLPNDEPAHGFDNQMLGTLSPTLLDRYVTAAQKIARLAVGAPSSAPDGSTFRIRPDVTQENHVEGLPLGTRGGTLIPYVFPQDGDYEIEVRLARDRNEHVEGLSKPHEVEFLLDRTRLALFTVKPPGADKNSEAVDTHLKQRFAVSAGPHDVGITFIKEPTVVLETERMPYASHFNMHRHPRTVPAVYQVTITGPFNSRGPGDTPSRRILFGSTPVAPTVTATEGEVHARQILAPLLHRAFRRPVKPEDFTAPLRLFHEGYAAGGFETGLERALSAILVSPQFLFRIERDPPGLASGQAYRLTDLELASRLAFFLWSSLPDDELLALAERDELHRPEILAQQTRRLLADPRARNLVSNFATQWLHLRALDAVTPDQRLFIDFDDNLRQALRTETELFFASVLGEDRSVPDLLTADYTFLNERLAKHYGIPHVYGSHFRRVSFAGDPARQRGGLLRQGSLLTVTSYATRTSPVIRGKWILDNLLGTPPPPPPPNIPALDNNVISANLPIRERLAVHRQKEVCASCHDVIDPIGFALENFDAVGRWRTLENFHPVDNSGGLADGSTFHGVDGLEHALLARPDLFAGNVAEKLLVFALGRNVGPLDAPAVRNIVRQAAPDQYRFSSLILGIVNSTPFQMRTTP